MKKEQQWLPPEVVPMDRRTIVIGAGTTAAAMAHAVEALWPVDAPLSGIVVTPERQQTLRPSGLAPRIEVVEVAHPVPDARSADNARRMLALVQGLSQKDVVLCLMSGAGPELLTLPVAPLTVAEKQRIVHELLQRRASTAEMDCVRRHLSLIRGGRLAAACAPAQVVTLALDDGPAGAMSCPTQPDTSTCNDALAVLQRYGIELPDAVLSLLRHGELETPKPWSDVFANHRLHVIATR
ncbi:MAG TPA: glycerate-2-kinase family protein [Ramlibacter sp.]|nr:glycerate-2-kinase family protein [Ramlibacter sp.]